MKNRILCITIITVVTLVQTLYVVYATSSYNAHEIIYDNTASGLESTTVNGAIQELYESATDYSSLQQRVSNLSSSKIDNVSPVLSGIPQVPTTSLSTYNSNYISNTNWVMSKISEYQNGIGKMWYGGSQDSGFTFGCNGGGCAYGYNSDASITITESGNYILLAAAQFTNESLTGTREVIIYGSDHTIQCKREIAAAQSANTLVSFGCIAHLDANETIYTSVDASDALDVEYSKIDTRLYAIKVH